MIIGIQIQDDLLQVGFQSKTGESVVVHQVEIRMVFPVQAKDRRSQRDLQDLSGLGGRLAAQGNALSAVDYVHCPVGHLRLHVIQVLVQHVTVHSVVIDQGETIPGVAHAVLLEGGKEE